MEGILDASERIENHRLFTQVAIRLAVIDIYRIPPGAISDPARRLVV